MRALIICGALLALPTSALAEATTVTEARQMVRQWFHGYEFVPQETHYKRVGPHLAAALASLALDEGEALFVRARAVSAMVFAPGPITEPVLTRIAEAETLPSLLRRKAVLVLADSYGDAHLALLVGIFAAAAEDLPLREATARALGSLQTPSALAARERLHAFEKVASVRALLAPPKRIGGEASPTKGGPIEGRRIGNGK